jgi:tetratricopeptide (TPR) repeat protein
MPKEARMRERHLTKGDIRHFVEREHDEVEMKLFLHHLAVCPSCHASGGYVLDLYLAGALPERFSSIDLDLALSRSRAPKLYAKLSVHAFAKQKGLLKDLRMFRSWGLAELLCAESLAMASQAPGKALELAELAVLLSSLLGPWEPADEVWLFELRAYAWAHLGNARRVIGELRSAEEAFQAGDRLWAAADGMGDVLDYEAKILALKASLRRTQGRFPESLDLLEQALSASGGGALQSEIMASRAFTLGDAGDLAGAVEAFRKSISATDRTTPPRILYVLHHNLLDSLSKAGNYDEATKLLPKVRSLSKGTGDELDVMRFRWVEARILAGSGNRRLALAQFGEVRQAFLDRGLLFDSMLVGLELAALHLAENEHEAVITLAEDLFEVFTSEGVPREAFATLSVFCAAAKVRVATVELAGAARSALENLHTSSIKRARLVS